MHLESPLWSSSGSILGCKSWAEASLVTDQAEIAAWGVFDMYVSWKKLCMRSWYNHPYNLFINWPVEVLYIFGVHFQLKKNLSFSCCLAWNTGLFSSGTLISTNYCVSKSIIDHPSPKLFLLLMTVALFPLTLFLYSLLDILILWLICLPSLGKQSFHLVSFCFSVSL